ncbi:O-antigen ligase family protein [Stenotrophomonas sp. 24(2023)]|uniref:O-antigen ligase family protein n=1 Tax=Stenotrophomonas sp. 24(2023) TaxID=3068324 RepID=UPI0027E1477D|nr:O-antigen ligase family protein [Stenotrophomonas sp. 24(2023)]WMJ70652.1 O-antigen ligase family protein [Stenotrophomonas sp. 24(2023)]
MTTTDGGSAGYYLLVLLAVLLLALPRAPGLPVLDTAHRRAYLGLGIAAGVLLLGVMVSLLVHGLWKGSEVEKGARLLTVVGLLLAALRVPRPVLARALLGTLPAVWCAAATVGWLVLSTGGRPATAQFNAVTYGDLTLLFSVICFFSLGMQLTPWRRTETVLKVITCVLGVGAFLLTQTRGGLLAIPCFVLIGILVQGRRMNLYKWAGALVLLAGIGALVAQDSSLRQRIDAGVSEYSDCQPTHLADTSVCIRLQLWNAALHMYRSEPWVGVGGGDRFRQELEALASQQKVSEMVARDFGEAHNDLLYFMATYGVLGGLGLVLTYLAPALLFAPRLWRGSPAQRLFAGAGMAMCVGFAVFGITEMMLRDMRTASFYAAWIGLFLALSHRRAEDAADQPPASAAR